MLDALGPPCLTASVIPARRAAAGGNEKAPELSGA